MKTNYREKTADMAWSKPSHSRWGGFLSKGKIRGKKDPEKKTQKKQTGAPAGNDKNPKERKEKA